MKTKVITRIQTGIIFSLLLPFLTACSGVGNFSRGDSQKDNVSTASQAACNGAGSYRANGRKYTALKSAAGYQVDGVAQLYNNKVQGSQTAGCESFDINGFTAAHRTLPLPTYVKITNKNNAQSVVVKINDRGPATGNGVIQVTPAVANILGATGATFPVHIEAITRQAPAATAVKPTSVEVKGAKRLPVNSKVVHPANQDRYYIIVGTYPSRDDAFDRFVRVSSIGLAKATMETRQLKGRTLHMVRLGPYYEQFEIDQAKDKLKNDGLVNFKIVKN